MSKFGLVIILILMAGSNYAQDYFVFIQADNQQPFYIRLGSQVYSSSAGGHLILSQLKDSTYSLTLGLPGKGTQEEQRYLLSIHQKDQEFRLKDQGENGWGLYDEQTREMKTPEPILDRREEFRPLGIKKDDAFSRLMAGVVYDTAVLYNTYAMEQILLDSPAVVKTPLSTSSSQTPRPPASDSSVRDTGSAVIMMTKPGDTSAIIPAMDSAVSATSTPVNPPPVVMPVAPKPDTAATANTAGLPLTGSQTDSSIAAKPGSRPRSVVKLSERKLARSVRLAYADRSPGKKADTIILFIPVDTLAIVKGVQGQVKKTDSTRIATPRNHGPNPDSPLLSPGQNVAARPASSPAVTEVNRSHPVDTSRKSLTTKSSLPFVNSDCHNYATDYDVDKLRVKLLEASKDEDRIQAARKVFKTRCFSTRQIRALSEVFTTDAAKFHFFETSYPFCSDDQFRELSSLLADPVYNSKFRVMTEHN